MTVTNGNVTAGALASAQLDEQAIAWVERSDREDWSQTDQVALDEWLARSDAHMVSYLRVESRWRRADRLAALRGSFHPQRTPLPKPKDTTLRNLLAGAAVLLILAGAWLVWPAGKTTKAEYATAIGEHKVVEFSDGTKLELNTDSRIRAQFRARSRTVWVDKGEVFLQVAHNAHRPFVALVGNERITDLGTKFTVNRQSNRVRVTMVEGRAKIDVPGKPKVPGKVLLPGDVALATSSTLSITRKPIATIENDLAWRRGVLVLNHTSLADAAAEMNRYNKRKIIITDGEAAQQRVDGTFPTTNVELFGRAAKNILGLHVTHRGSDVVISR